MSALKAALFIVILFSISALASETELKELIQRAGAGDASAQSQLGYYYLIGEKVGKDIEIAKSWLQKAANQGDIEAAYDLGVLSEGERNYLSAVRFYRMAEKDTYAELRLARLYSEGLGVARDEAAAADLIISATESGEAEALYMAGLAYRYGKGIPVDYEKALNNFLEASHRLYPPAYTQVGKFYEEGIGVESDREAAESYYRKAHNAGDTEGIYLLGALLEKKLNFEEAAFYYEAAAERGDNRSAAKLASFYENGIGVEKDYLRAVSLYLKSVGTDGGFSENRLGIFYRSGFGVEADPEAAREWFIKSIRQGYTISYKALGYMYILGNFGEVNQVRGCAYLYRSGDEKDGAYCDGILAPRAQKAAKNLEIVR
ncbi:MAG: sel1 repeat family protein [Deferribacteraceae bacterium]|jgi:TPR repeat protein|nr:sel1 repeat family protein [Deferribacteraceae bacterium]